MTEQSQQTQQTPEQIRAEIERTRRELGDTVDALSHKANVKEQARIKKDEVQEKVTSNSTPIAAGIGGLIVLLVVLRLIKRR